MSDICREKEDGANPRQRPRRRAVRLGDDAALQLKAALYEKWQSKGEAGRLTREGRATLLGVSVATADRIWAQQGVDRNTLVLVFKTIGLDWDDAMCEYVRPADEKEETTESDRPAEAVAPSGRAHKRRLWLLLLPAGALLLLAILGPIRQEVTYLSSKKNLDSLGDEFNLKLDKGTKDFQAGSYSSAASEINRAIAIARRLESVEKLALAQRIAGDIASALGDLTEAKNCYVQALEMRKSLADERSLPALYEALGDLETRAGAFKSAKEHLLVSLAGYQREKDSGGVAMAYRDLGTLAFEQGQLDEASRQFDMANEALQAKSEPAMLMDIKAREALVMTGRGQFAEAQRVLRACLEFWERENQPRWIATTKYQLGTVASATQNHGDARLAFVTARELFVQVGDTAGAQKCDLALGKLNKLADGSESRYSSRLVSSDLPRR